MREVFAKKAEDMHSPIVFAEDKSQIISFKRENECLVFETVKNGTIIDALSGDCQVKNANTALHAIHILQEKGLNITQKNIEDGFAQVCSNTGLMGRWMVVNQSPRTICDTGHNTGGVQYIVHQLAKEKYHKLHIVLGFVNDKDVTHILEMFPRYATYYFTNASIPRAMPAKDLFTLASAHDLEGNYYASVSEAYQVAKEEAKPDDMIFVGGSTFIVADFLEYLQKKQIKNGTVAGRKNGKRRVSRIYFVNESGNRFRK